MKALRALRKTVLCQTDCSTLSRCSVACCTLSSRFCCFFLHSSFYFIEPPLTEISERSQSEIQGSEHSHFLFRCRTQSSPKLSVTANRLLHGVTKGPVNAYQGQSGWLISPLPCAVMLCADLLGYSVKRIQTAGQRIWVCNE